MASAQQLKRRIKSVDNTSKITKAMSMIAASKMTRAQQMALQGRPYAERMMSLLSDLAAQPQFEDDPHPLLTPREIKKIGVIVITPDRGLTGGLNTSVNRFAAQHILNSGYEAEVVAVGKKARDFFGRTSNLKAVFTDMGDRPTVDSMAPITKVVVDEYTQGNIDAVYVVYSKFVNTTVQKPELITILPVEPAELENKDKVGYIYEPDSSHVLNELLPRYIEMEIYHSILESIASEQSARMVAMRNATDNALEMKSDLTLEMNKVRQESITSELLDIVGGVAAVEG
ncbi:MAG: ATP synthase F1 subunit gamma [Dehalococcoidia bacterium]|nr:ATP synthase F1 subunit gamma [Dehalococcoidia bacterium]MQG16258.1 ATP synthase F1 subunit gamma [SAR202 cluster bacterium]